MYESNGPDIKICGTASHVAEKYLQLARDAQSSGDPVAAENYYQHAEHYFRLIAAAQEQFRQSQPYFQQGGDQRGNLGDDGYDDGDEQPPVSGEPFAPREQQHQQNQPQQFQPRQQNDSSNEEDVERLPSFITGGGGQPQQQPQQQQPTQQGQGHNGGNGPDGSNGQNGYDGSADRFPLHRRRRRHRGPRDHSMQGDGDAPSGPRSSDD